MSIDWTKPLELDDGTPVVLRNHGFCGGPNPDSDDDYWIVRVDGLPIGDLASASACVGGARGTGCGVKVRNRPAPAPEPAPLMPTDRWWAQRWIDKATPGELAAMRELLA